MKPAECDKSMCGMAASADCMTSKIVAWSAGLPDNKHKQQNDNDQDPADADPWTNTMFCLFTFVFRC